jgi:tetratricopeptide (TPR) repeat protein
MTSGLMGDPYPMRKKSAVRDSLYARAERYARRAVRVNPAGDEGHVALAASLGRAAILVGPEEKVRRAGLIREEALRALAINPRQDEAHHILGRWNAEIMRLPGITRFFAKHFLGAQVFDEASWPRAIDHLEQAVRLAPNRIAHRVALADIYAECQAASESGGSAPHRGHAAAARGDGYELQTAGGDAARAVRRTGGQADGRTGGQVN